MVDVSPSAMSHALAVVVDFMVPNVVSSCSAIMNWTDLLTVSLTAPLIASCMARDRLLFNEIDLMMSNAALPSLSAKDVSLFRLRFPDK